MGGCSRCETLPGSPPEKGVLYVAPPLAHTRSTLRRLLKGFGAPFEEDRDGILAVELPPDGLRELSRLVREGLGEGELRDSRALLVEEGVVPSLRELARMQDLGTLTAAVEGEWLLEILREDGLIVHFQPIVSTSEAGTEAGGVFAYECLLRGLDADGAIVSPGRMFGAARPAGLLFNLDRAARIKAIEAASEHGIEANVFINFNPSSIYDPVYCLRSTMEAVERTGIPPERIVFEVTESEEISDSKRLLDILSFYRDAGFRVALDDLGAGYSSLGLLTELRPDFVKLDMGLTRDVDRDPYRALISARIIALARDLGVGVVAEGVETSGQWRWLREHGATYAQGFFFARPGSPPPVPAPATAKLGR